MIVTVSFTFFPFFFQWEPSRLELVSKDMVDRCFTGIDDDDDWQFLQLPDRSSMAEVLKPKL